MGIKNLMVKAGKKAADTVSKLSALSSEQLERLQDSRDDYLNEMPSSDDVEAQELTMRLLAASGVEIYNAYLPQLQNLYVPIDRTIETGQSFDVNHNIRYFDITKWVTDKKENNLEKLVNVYQVLSGNDCNIALIFHRECSSTRVSLAVSNTQNSKDNVSVNHYKDRLLSAIKGNFPGAEVSQAKEGTLPCFEENKNYSVACASNIPTEKSEKFISQTIEKLLDGIVPINEEQEFILILLATPVTDVEERKLRLGELYSGLAPYSSWSTDFRLSESDSLGSSATFGVNVGASAGMQKGQTTALTDTKGVTDSTNRSETDTIGTTNTKSDSEGVAESTTDSVSDTKSSGTTNTTGSTETEGTSHTEGKNTASTDTKGSSDTVSGGPIVVTASHGMNQSTSHTLGETIADMTSESLSKSSSQSLSNSTAQTIAKATARSITTSVAQSVANSTGRAIANSLGKAVTKSTAKTAGAFRGLNFGVNFGANFARTSSVTTTIGKNEGITQNHVNYTIKHTLSILEEQMKRYEKSTALGMWDFAAYVLSEDQDIANNVAYSYLALTQGEESYISKAAVNLWRGDVEKLSNVTQEICAYLKELRHPMFGLNPSVLDLDPTYHVYPPLVTATTTLSGKELAYSLNFPQRSVAGLSVIECSEFGRNITSYEEVKEQDSIKLGKIFHMNSEEKSNVLIQKQSLASHTFITGSTGSGKSNTVYKLLEEARKSNIKFLVIEPAKGEYKEVFGSDEDVSVYGTNPNLSPLLRINPFSFPNSVHILEHLDRLIEIFNVCWPMYAAMPAVLKNSVEKAYEDCGWNLVKSVNIYKERLYPTFADVSENVRKIIDSSEYDSENKGAYKGSLITRLQSLTSGINRLIFSTEEIDPTDLFDENVIVDLSRVGSTETKALIMGMLVLKLQEHRMVSARAISDNLKHLTVLEEAHNLLRRVSFDQNMEGSNILGRSVEMLSNAIAEMRTYGEGFIIVDQAPGLLDMSAIRNTNTKIIMRLPDQSDRELVGRSANLNEDQIKELSRLPRGVAAIYQNEWIEPVLCKVQKVDITDKRFSYSPREDDLEKNTSFIKDELFHSILEKEILRKNRKKDLFSLRDIVMKSGLSTSLKKAFLEYIQSQDEESFAKLAGLVYEFFESDRVFTETQGNTDIREWVKEVVERINPSVKDYSKEQINLLLMLMTYELSLRDSSYNDVFVKMNEIYRAEGGVY